MFAGVSIQLDFTYTLPFPMKDMSDVKPISNLHYNHSKLETLGNAFVSKFLHFYNRNSKFTIEIEFEYFIFRLFLK